MRDIESRRFEMFLSVEAFGRAHANLFNPGRYTSNLFAELSNLIKELNEHLAAQKTEQSVVRGKVSNKQALKADLVAEMKTISSYAEIMSQDIPELEGLFDLPYRMKDRDLLNLGKSFAKLGQKYEQQFKDYDMPSDFLADLNEQIRLYEEALTHSTTAGNAQVEATDAVSDSIERGMAIVERLKVAVGARCRNDKLLMMSWKTACHVERARTSSRSDNKPDPKPTDETNK